MDQERRRRYQERYDAQKKLGKPFWPDTIFKDAVASLIIFLILIALAVFLGTPLEERADPTNTAYVPRPEWYFMFLFELLKYFPGELEWVGVALIPGLAILVIFLLPVLDRGHVRHPRQRRLAINFATVAVLGVVFLTLKSYDVTPTTAMSMLAPARLVEASAPKVPQPKLTAAQDSGRRLFQSQNCASCHKLGGTGGSVGPDLTHVGSRHDAAWLHEYIEKPKNLNPNAMMPAFIPPMTHQEVEWLAQYLATLR